jgi:predicted O-methyltransferase YrrM
MGAQVIHVTDDIDSNSWIIGLDPARPDYCHCQIDKDQPSALFYAYQQSLMLPVFLFDAPSILILGVGAGASLSHAALVPNASVVGVEVSSALIDLAADKLKFAHRDKVHIMDAREASAKISGSFDVIQVDVVDANAQISLYDEAFYVGIMSLLASGGWLAVNMSSQTPISKANHVAVLQKLARDHGKELYLFACGDGDLVVYLGSCSPDFMARKELIEDATDSDYSDVIDRFNG